MLTDLRKARELFLHAVGKLPAEQWEGYVAEACGEDADLAQQVGCLLQVHREAGSFLDAPAPGLELPGTSTALYPRLAEGPGTVIGPYKLLQQIGEGGMGVVFMAEQTEPIQRTVALKIIKPGMDTRQVIARFEAERQAVAMMDHPNIARVIDAGTTDTGRPYFVMDLVKGVPITDYCDAQHLPIRARLELVSAVCHAVQHAHQKGIIHRDLKPSNVLVAEYDGRPVPKIIDFGVAKATAHRLTEKTMFTELGQMIGTVEYMSPEQARFNQLDVDTRSDIYSLGVLLYEILAGSTPFGRKRLNEAAFDEMLRIIREEEPPKPSTRLSSSDALPSIAANRGLEPLKLNRLVQGELDWIVMKALEKDRNRRYDTASGLAADIQRHLNDEPVHACPPSPAYRFRKFVRRNKGPAFAVSIVLLALIVGVVGTTWGMARAEQQRRLAELNAQKAIAAAEVAQRREAESKAVLEFVENKIFAAAGPEGKWGGLGRDVTLRRAIEAALPYVEKSFADQPLVEARLRTKLGISFWQLGEAGDAVDQLQKARALFIQHVGRDHHDTLRCTNNLANVYIELGRYANALKLHEETFAIRETNLGRDHIDTLSSMNNLAVTYNALGRYADALKLREETSALMKARLGPDHPDTLISMGNLAASYESVGRYGDAVQLAEATLVLQKARLGPDHPDTLTSMGNLAAGYNRLGRYADALKLGEETLAMRKARLGSEHPRTLLNMDNLVESYCKLGRYADAVKLSEETLAIREAKLGHDHPHTLASMFTLAKTYRAVDRRAEGLKLMEETLALRADKLGTGHPDTSVSMNELAGWLATDADPATRNPARAVDLATRAVESAPQNGNYWNTLGLAYYCAGDWQAAVAALDKSMKLRNGGDSADFYFLAMAHWKLGHKDEARKWYDQAVEWMETNNPNNEQLRRFRAEAAELLGIAESQSPTSPQPVENEVPNTDNPTSVSPLNPKP